MRHSLVIINGNLVYGFGSCRQGQIGKPASEGQRFCTNPEIIQGLENSKLINLFANGDCSAALTEGEVYMLGAYRHTNLDGSKSIPSSCTSCLDESDKLLLALSILLY